MKKLFSRISRWLDADPEYVRGTIRIFDKHGNTVLRAEFRDSQLKRLVVADSDILVIVQPGQTMPPELP